MTDDETQQDGAAAGTGGDQTIYRPPSSDVSGQAPATELAERMTRLFAALIDGVIALAAMLPLILGGGLDPESGEVSTFAAGLSGLLFLGLLGYQLYLLNENGWTIGKKALGIRIVNDDGSDAGLGRIFGLRILIPALLGAIPVAGSIFALADPLFIFTESRKCLHDHIASTIVVKA